MESELFHRKTREIDDAVIWKKLKISQIKRLISSSSAMNESNRKLFFAQLKKDNPSPTTELEYNSNFELLIAVILSAQATDTSVNKATFKLYEVAKTPQEVLN